MVTPVAKRKAVAHLMEAHQISQRRDSIGGQPEGQPAAKQRGDVFVAQPRVYNPGDLGRPNGSVAATAASTSSEMAQQLTGVINRDGEAGVVPP